MLSVRVYRASYSILQSVFPNYGAFGSSGSSRERNIESDCAYAPTQKLECTSFISNPLRPIIKCV